MSTISIDVYLEVGEKRIFAAALDWPGWCRSGRDEESALQALFDYAPRYAAVLQSGGPTFTPPETASTFTIVERLPGTASTDYGAPGEIPSADSAPLSADEHSRLEAILRACWAALDAAIDVSAGHELRKGPRGGGRERDAIIQHVIDGDRGYLMKLGWPLTYNADDPLDDRLALLRTTILDGIAASMRGEIEPTGPRGGERWPVRYFIRRTAWHVLDHVWEIEDRIQ